MKIISILLIFLSTCTLLHAQDAGKTVSFNFTKTDKRVTRQFLQTTEKGSSGSAVLLIKTFKMPLKKTDPFVSFSARLEGNNLAEGNIEVSIKKNNEKDWIILPHFHEGEGHTDIWVSNMFEMDSSFKKISIKIQEKNIKVRKYETRFLYWKIINL